MVFYKVVFTITAVLAILVLAAMGIIMLIQDQNVDWPPDVAECPDYWKVTGKDTCAANTGIGNAGSTGVQTFNAASSCGAGPGGSCGTYSEMIKMNGTPGALASGSPRCMRHKWAVANGVYWDGISDIDPSYCGGGPPPPASAKSCPGGKWNLTCPAASTGL